MYTKTRYLLNRDLVIRSIKFLYGSVSKYIKRRAFSKARFYEILNKEYMHKNSFSIRKIADDLNVEIDEIIDTIEVGYCKKHKNFFENMNFMTAYQLSEFLRRKMRLRKRDLIALIEEDGTQVDHHLKYRELCDVYRKDVLEIAVDLIESCY